MIYRANKMLNLFFNYCSKIKLWNWILHCQFNQENSNKKFVFSLTDWVLPNVGNSLKLAERENPRNLLNALLDVFAYTWSVRVKIENTKTKLKDSYYSSSRLHSFNHHKTCNLRITHHLPTHSFSSFFLSVFLFILFYSQSTCLSCTPTFLPIKNSLNSEKKFSIQTWRFFAESLLCRLGFFCSMNSIKLKLTCWCILCKNDFTQTGDDLPWSNIDFWYRNKNQQF